MKVRELKELLAEVDDEALVVVASSDHSYREGHVVPCLAYVSSTGELSEDHGPENAMPGDKAIPVLFVY